MAEADDTLAPETAPLRPHGPSSAAGVFATRRTTGSSRGFIEAVRAALEAQDGDGLARPSSATCTSPTSAT